MFYTVEVTSLRAREETSFCLLSSSAMQNGALAQFKRISYLKFIAFMRHERH